MDLIFNVSNLTGDEDKFSSSKKDVLKYLKIIGVDTRFISYTPDKIYINNLRFSRFSRTREETFKKQYSEIEVVRSKLFQKICAKSSKHLALEIKPNSRILMPQNNYLIELIMDPYTRKYGVELVYDGDYDLCVNPLILDDQVNNIFEGLFKAKGLNYIKNNNEIYPLVNVSLDWINSFLKMDGRKLIEAENSDEMANSFSKFLEDVAPQYKENVVSAAEFVCNQK